MHAEFNRSRLTRKEVNTDLRMLLQNGNKPVEQTIKECVEDLRNLTYFQETAN